VLIPKRSIVTSFTVVIILEYFDLFYTNHFYQVMAAVFLLQLIIKEERVNSVVKRLHFQISPVF